MRELKVGDKFVVVKTPVYNTTMYWNESMNKFLGKQLTVVNYNDVNECYAVDENMSGWTKEMIDWVETEKLYSNNDTVNSPSHYCTGAVETIESIKNIVTGNPSAYHCYLVGNVVKYVSRYHKKGGAEDIRKAIKYLEFVLKDIEDEDKQV